MNETERKSKGLSKAAAGRLRDRRGGGWERPDQPVDQSVRPDQPLDVSVCPQQPDAPIGAESRAD